MLRLRSFFVGPAAQKSCLNNAVTKAFPLQEQMRRLTIGTDSSTSDIDTVGEFLNATKPTEYRTVKTIKKDIRVSPRKLTYLAQQVLEIYSQSYVNIVFELGSRSSGRRSLTANEVFKKASSDYC